MRPALFAGQGQAAAWAAELPPGAVGRERFDFCLRTGSTQDLAFAAAAAGAPHGAVFVTDEQTAGRGRQGPAWLAPAGSSLLLSVLLRPAPSAKALARAALGAALAACRSVEKVCAAHPVIKWPNDLLLGNRKLGGILVESRGKAAALGVGLNLLQSRDEFGGDLAGAATSLAAETGDEPDRSWVLAFLLVELGGLLGDSPEDWGTVRLEVARRLAWRGRRVRAGRAAGVLVGLDELGRLLVDPGSGKPCAVSSGSLELVS